MSNSRTFTKKDAKSILSEHFGAGVEFDVDRVATKTYAIYLPIKPEGIDPMVGVIALRKAYPDYQFSLL